MSRVVWAIVATSGFVQPTVSLAQLQEVQAFSIEREEAVVAVPLEDRGGKLFLDAAVNGESGRFVFDTGSPTILTKTFADRLGLVPFRQNTGRDANGRTITMDVALAETISLGGVTFRNVPVLIHDFAGVPLADCFFEAGLIGSEVLKGSAWRLDLASGTMMIAEPGADFERSSAAKSAALNDFGYPHAPVIPYKIGKFSDSALFDTGSASYVSLFNRVAEDRAVRRSIDKQSLTKGRGSQGISGGGLGESTDIAQYQLKTFQIGDLPLREVPTRSKNIPPTLIGAGLLKTHVVTLDYPGGKAWFEPREDGSMEASKPSFSVSALDHSPVVTQLFDDSAAKRAGLKLDDLVLQIDGRDLAYANDKEKCSTAQWLWQEFDPASVRELIVQRGGETMQLTLESQ